VKVGDLVEHTQQNFIGVIVEKLRRNPVWTCDMWRVLAPEGVILGTDNNLEVIG